MTADVFIDSGAFIAFLDASDRQHADAEALFANLPRRSATSLLVVSETYSWFLHRMGEEAARTFRGLLAALPGMRLLAADNGHHAAVGRTLDALRGCKLTYVDASSLVFIAQKKIRLVWATDHHLTIEGARIVPGPP